MRFILQKLKNALKTLIQSFRTKDCINICLLQTNNIPIFSVIQECVSNKIGAQNQIHYSIDPSPQTNIKPKNTSEREGKLITLMICLILAKHYSSKFF
jgi:hypothetical protein